MATAAASLWVKLGIISKEFEAGLKKAENNLKKFGERMDTLGMRITKGISLPIAGVGIAAVKMAADMEVAKVALTTLTGSVNTATKQMEKLKQFSATTPFQFTELLGATRRMMAFGFQAKQTVPILRVLGNASFALGQGAEGVNNMILALGQMKMKGRAQSEELTRQLGQYVGAWQYLADYLGTDVAGAMDMVQKKMIDGGTAVKAVLQGIANDPKFKDGMKKQAETLAGIWSNFRDQLAYTLADIGGLLVKTFDLKNVVINVSKAMKAFSDWFAKLDPGMRKLVAYGAAAAAAFGPLLIVIGKMALGWSAMIPVVGKTIGLITGLGGAIIKTTTATAAATAATTAMAGAQTAASATSETLTLKTIMASKAVTGLATAFGKFLVGGAIIGGLAAAVAMIGRIVKNIRIAKTAIEDIKTLSDLEEKRQSLEEQKTYLERQRKVSPIDKFLWGGAEDKSKEKQNTGFLEKYLSGGVISDFLFKSPTFQASERKKALEKINADLKEVEKQRKKLMEPTDDADKIQKEIDDMIASIKAALEPGQIPKDNAMSKLSSLLDQWRDNLTESKTALLKNLDAIAQAQKDAVDVAVVQQKKELAEKYKGLEQTKEYNEILSGIDETAENKRIKIDQDLYEQKKQIQQKMNNDLLQAQMTAATDSYQKLQLELRQMQNIYETNLAKYKAQGVDTSKYSETYNLQVMQKYVEYYKQLADSVKKARDYMQELAKAAALIGKPDWFKSFDENDKAYNERVKKLNNMLADSMQKRQMYQKMFESGDINKTELEAALKGLKTLEDYNEAKANADKIWAANHTRLIDEAYKSDVDKFTKKINDEMQLDKELTREQKRQIEQRLANQLLTLDPNLPEYRAKYDAMFNIYKKLSKENIASSDIFGVRWKAGLEDALNSFGTFGDNVQKMASNITSSMQSAFSGGFFNILKGNFDDLGDAVTTFLDTILRQITDMWSQAFTTNVMKSGFGNWLGKLMGTATSNVSENGVVDIANQTALTTATTTTTASMTGLNLATSTLVSAFNMLNAAANAAAGSLSTVGVTSSFDGKFASGGYISPGHWGITGEQGPEPIFAGKTGATILPNGSLNGSGGGNVSINIINNSGNQVAAKITSKKTDSIGNQAITLVMDSINRNVNGSRDFFKKLR